jgi:hypothetical protein
MSLRDTAENLIKYTDGKTDNLVKYIDEKTDNLVTYVDEKVGGSEDSALLSLLENPPGVNESLANDIGNIKVALSRSESLCLYKAKAKQGFGKITFDVAMLSCIREVPILRSIKYEARVSSSPWNRGKLSNEDIVSCRTILESHEDCIKYSRDQDMRCVYLGKKSQTYTNHNVAYQVDGNLFRYRKVDEIPDTDFYDSFLYDLYNMESNLPNQNSPRFTNVPTTDPYMLPNAFKEKLEGLL